MRRGDRVEVVFRREERVREGALEPRFSTNRVGMCVAKWGVMRNKAPRLLILVGSVGLLACSGGTHFGDDAGSDQPDSGAADGGTDASHASDTGGGPVSDASDAAASTNPVPTSYIVFDNETNAVATGGASFVSAELTTSANALELVYGMGPEHATCTEKSLGACYTVSCVQTGSISLASAGSISITGTSVDGALYQAPYGEYFTTVDATIFAAGATLNVSATGSTVPAFNETITSPSLVTITSPAGTNAKYVIPSTSDFDLTWTGGQAGAQVVFEGFTPTNTWVVCAWDATAGKGTIPQAALATLPSAYTGIFGQTNKKTFSAGAYNVELYAMQTVTGSVFTNCLATAVAAGCRGQLAAP